MIGHVRKSHNMLELNEDTTNAENIAFGSVFTSRAALGAGSSPAQS